MNKDELKKALIEGGAAWDEARAHLADAPDAFRGGDFSESGFSGQNLANLDFSNADFYKADFCATNLKNSVFTGADLTNAAMKKAALYKADFGRAVLQEANLSHADLSATNCEGADFRGAVLTGANLSGANLRNADFSHADLSGADLSRSDITAAKFHFAKLTDANVTHLVYGGFRAMAGLYYGVRGVDATYGNALFVRDAKDQDYIDTLQQMLLDKPAGSSRRAGLFLFRAWALIDHGRSLPKVAGYAFLIATIYGLIYLMDMKFDWQIMDYSNSARTWFTPFYYSVVTYTTLGFGDVTADSLLGEILVISEVIIGYFTLGLLLAILANTIARRS